MVGRITKDLDYINASFTLTKKYFLFLKAIENQPSKC
ncbi:hypothetical protein RSOCI_03835 [Rhabdochlamydiaceae symbiont of Dictyostelium giganteum]